MKCDKCSEEFAREFPEVIYNQWLKLVYYFDHQLSEDEITDATHISMVESLFSLKPKEE